MAEITIDSIDDPRISVYRNLPKSKLAEASRRFIVEGPHLVERLLTSEYETESILTAATHVDWVQQRVGNGVPVYVARKHLVQEIVGFRFHRGVLACGLRRPLPTVSEIVPAPPTASMLVVLSDIKDSENVGGILRAAAAFGVDGVVLGPRCADPFSRRVARVSMGAVWKLRLATSHDLEHDVAWLQDQAGVDVVATVLDRKAERLDRARRPLRMALLLGSEGHGLAAGLIRRCRRRVTIPMKPGVDSLNVTMATSIFLYHFTQNGCSPELPAAAERLDLLERAEQ